MTVDIAFEKGALFSVSMFTLINSFLPRWKLYAPKASTIANTDPCPKVYLLVSCDYQYIPKQRLFS